MKVISFENVVVKTIERSELALSERDYPKAREFFDKAYRLYTNAKDDNPTISNRLHDLENALFYR